MRATSLAVLGSAVLLAGTGWGQVTQRVSVASSGAQAAGSSNDPSISSDGRYVVFTSSAEDLVASDTNLYLDVFLRDRQLGTTERLSVSSSGAQGDGNSFVTNIGVPFSPDMRWVLFRSEATNLVPLDTNGVMDAFLRDRLTGTTERISVDSNGHQGFDESQPEAITPDGRFVLFTSMASLVPSDTNVWKDVYLRDRQLGTTERVSVATGGAQGNGDSIATSMSADARTIVFWSYARNLVPGDSNGYTDVFVRDRLLGTTERISVDPSGGASDGDSYSTQCTPDGRYVLFGSFATNLVAGDQNAFPDVFLRDLQNGTTELVSLGAGGVQGDHGGFPNSMSADARTIAFESYSTNLVPLDTNHYLDVFLRDRQLGTTELATLRSDGVQGTGDSRAGFLSTDGRYVAFASDATNLAFEDTNAGRDVFVRDRLGAPAFTSSCDPGTGGVIACPCSNAPSGSGRGCDNSSATGGAALSASGGTFLSSDSLVFTTSGERPTATSIVLQGTSSPAAGVVYGQGVRCVAGTLKRLYTKLASSGSITAPEFGAGEPPVSVQSAAKGDTIFAGQSRWYLVFYRDPTVLGGCPATSTFNATQSGCVVWNP